MALSRVWSLYVEDHRATPSEKQDHFLTLGARRIDIAMHCTCRDVEEISWTNGNGMPSTRTILKASSS
jgi:hypothetical protein